ncbi:MAG TPA: hypothetical protein VMU06_01295 [Stellaceae bacterium]|nr:hypothetical protein [Stellaceae bacterium]
MSEPERIIEVIIGEYEIAVSPQGQSASRPTRRVSMKRGDGTWMEFHLDETATAQLDNAFAGTQGGSTRYQSKPSYEA